MTTSNARKNASLMDEQFQQLKVLIVEDQAEARGMLKNMLSLIGVHQIFEASDGKVALNFIDDAFDFIDMIICDWNMPEMDGAELLRQVRSTGEQIPFLMITGRGDKESVMTAKQHGVNGYIRKPFSSVQLEAKLRVLMHRMQNNTPSNI